MTEKSIDSNRLFYGRPNRKESIDKDEVISLKIDLEVLDIDQMYKKYFELMDD
ncbi:MAG: hypothetical protein ACLFSB_05685 [Chitinispirillaceae bacterium]